VTLRLHRCALTWVKSDSHPCWRVERALQEVGVEYEVVTEPKLPRRRRADVIENTGQNLLPAIEFEDGSWYRDESDRMVKRILAGELRAARL
jgi:glutaredoxin